MSRRNAAAHREKSRFVDDEHVPGCEPDLCSRQAVQEHVNLKMNCQKNDECAFLVRDLCFTRFLCVSSDKTPPCWVRKNTSIEPHSSPQVFCPYFPATILLASCRRIELGREPAIHRKYFDSVSLTVQWEQKRIQEDLSQMLDQGLEARP